MTPASLVVALSPILPFVVRGVEKLFGGKTGAQKFEAVTAATCQVVDQLYSAGRIETKPTTAEIHAAIQLTVDELNKSGQLKAESTAVSGIDQTTLRAGMTQVIEGSLKVLQAGTTL